jgi:hypothetical protein
VTATPVALYGAIHAVGVRIPGAVEAVPIPGGALQELAIFVAGGSSYVEGGAVAVAVVRECNLTCTSSWLAIFVAGGSSYVDGGAVAVAIVQ